MNFLILGIQSNSSSKNAQSNMCGSETVLEIPSGVCAKPHDVQLKEMGMEPCWHVWVQIGLWSDRLYMSNPILQCKICGQKQYVSKRDDD